MGPQHLSNIHTDFITYSLQKHHLNFNISHLAVIGYTSPTTSPMSSADSMMQNGSHVFKSPVMPTNRPFKNIIVANCTIFQPLRPSYAPCITDVATSDIQ